MATRIFNMYAAQKGRPLMTDQTKPNAETPFEMWWAEFIKKAPEMECPEAYAGAESGWHAALKFRAAETPKSETQQVPLIAIRILLEGKPGAALNAVVEDYPELAKMILSRKPEMQAGVMSAKGFACLILLQEELSLEWLEAQVAARDAKRDADARKIGETVALREAAINGCYCVCHSGSSSRNACVHCQPELYKDKHDPYCGLTSHGVQRIRALIPSGGQSLVDKHDAEIRAEALREVFNRWDKEGVESGDICDWLCDELGVR
jgi:hypothetical protein